MIDRAIEVKSMQLQKAVDRVLEERDDVEKAMRELNAAEQRLTNAKKVLERLKHDISGESKTDYDAIIHGSGYSCRDIREALLR